MGDLKIKEWLQASQWNRRNFAALLRETARLQNYLADLIEEDPKSNFKTINLAIRDQLGAPIIMVWDSGRCKYLEPERFEEIDIIKAIADDLEKVFLDVYSKCIELQEQRAKEEANCGA